MALNIEGATIGVDANNIQTALNNLNTKCIEDTINKMTTSMDQLRQSVDQVWVGESAETFKENMERDREFITKNLKATYDTLQSEMYQIVNAMSEADAELVEKRVEG